MHESTNDPRPDAEARRIRAALSHFTDDELRDALLGRGIEWDGKTVRLHRLPWMTDEKWRSLFELVRSSNIENVEFVGEARR